MIHLVHQEEEAFFRESTCSLRGLMAVAIFLSHILPMCKLEYGKSAITLLSSNAYLFVAVFFFLSGYGLFTSYATKPKYVEGFLCKRFAPLYVKNCVLVLFYSLIDIVLTGHSGGGTVSLLSHEYMRNIWLVCSGYLSVIFGLLDCISSGLTTGFSENRATHSTLSCLRAHLYFFECQRCVV